MGSGFTVTVRLVSAVQVLLVTFIEYVLKEVGVTTMEAVVSPVFQLNAEPPMTVSVVLLPAQIEVDGLAVIMAVIELVTVTVATALAEQMPLVTWTV